MDQYITIMRKKVQVGCLRDLNMQMIVESVFARRLLLLHLRTHAEDTVTSFY